MLKGAIKLSNKQKEKLNQVKKASPLVGIIHSLKEEFHSLFEKSKNLGEGILKLIDWIEKAEPYYRNSVPMIKRWFGEIDRNLLKIRLSQSLISVNNRLLLLNPRTAGNQTLPLLCSIRS
ncbi:transposase [Kamptonema sp. UHCC 0994]|uniref:transposase n=1 Tax=Kamptonema sp. UHCC 0994 TaxID=3031329 RepID=UPI0023B91772|nr:transposase [Kamptonema sp. UHCC 0994]MDF0555168.1 transposase [Kamptonema sp. UHCC 0994]